MKGAIMKCEWVTQEGRRATLALINTFMERPQSARNVNVTARLLTFLLVEENRHVREEQAGAPLNQPNKTRLAGFTIVALDLLFKI